MTWLVILVLLGMAYRAVKRCLMTWLGLTRKADTFGTAADDTYAAQEHWIAD